MYPQHRRRKKRHTHGLKTVELTRGRHGYGFTISGEQPCILSCIVSGSPADRAGLKTGDFLMAVNCQNVSKAPHDDVVRLIGSSTGSLVVQIAENYHDSDSSDEDVANRPKTKYPNRVRLRSRERELDGARDGFVRERNTHRHQGHHRKSGNHRSRAISPSDRYHDLPAAEPRTRKDRSRSRGIENINPLTAAVYPRRGKHNSEHSGTKHTIITRDARIIKSQSHPDGIIIPHHPTSRGLHPSRISAPDVLLNRREVPIPMPTSLSHGNLHRAEVHVPSGGMMAQELSNMLYPSLQPHMAQPTQDNMLPRDEDSDHSGEPNLRALVGYIGSIEMPRDANVPSSRLQSIRSAVRRLRVEHRIHTLVLMEVFVGGIKLSNAMGSVIAHYAADKVAFSGLCPDDNRFFGIVTLHSSSSEEGSEYGSQDDAVTSTSCHVFMVDLELRTHAVHAQKARNFGVHCTSDQRGHGCREFPRSATVILKQVAKLYKHRQGPVHDANVQNHLRSDSNTSNSDSGLGFGRDEAANDRVCVVEMAEPEPGINDSISASINAAVNASMSGSQVMAWDPTGTAPSWDPEHTFVTSHESSSLFRSEDQDSQDISAFLNSVIAPAGTSASEASTANFTGNSSHVSLDSAADGLERLNVRAMPNPTGRSFQKVKPDQLETQSSADDLRRSLHRMMQSRQRHTEHSGSDAESLRSDSSHGHAGALAQSSTSVRSGPWTWLDSSSTSVSTDTTVDTTTASVDSKLSPRALPSSGTTAGQRKKPTMAMPVLIPSIPIPSIPDSDMMVGDLQPMQLHPKKPPLPERKPRMPRTPVPATPQPERPKSTPPIRGMCASPAPLAREEEYDSDPGKSPLDGPDAIWTGDIPDEAPPARGPERNRRFSEGFLLSKLQKEKEPSHNLVKKAGSFKQFRLRRRGSISRSNEVSPTGNHSPSLTRC